MFRWGKRNDFWNNSSANDSRNNAIASIPNDFVPDKLPFDDKAKIDEFFDRMSKLVSHGVSPEDRKYFVDCGVTQEFLKPNHEIWYDTDNMNGYLNSDAIIRTNLDNNISDLLVNGLDYTDPHNQYILQSALRNYQKNEAKDDFILSKIYQKLYAIQQNPAKATNLQSELQLARIYAEERPTESFQLFAYPEVYNFYKDILPDTTKVKIYETEWLKPSALSAEVHLEYADKYQQLTGRNLDDIRDSKGKSRLEIMLSSSYNFNANSVKEIEAFYSGKIAHEFEKLPEKGSAEYKNMQAVFAKMVELAQEGTYPKTCTVCENITPRLYEVYGGDFITSTSMFAALYKAGKLDDQAKKSFEEIAAGKGQLEKYEPLFAANNETIFSMRSIANAVNFAKQHNDDTSVERAIQKPMQVDTSEDLANMLKQCTSVLNDNMDYLKQRPQIRQKILEAITPYTDYKYFSQFDDYMKAEYILLAGNYDKELPTAKMLTQAAEAIKKENIYLEAEPREVMAKFGIKCISPEKYMRYGKNRSLYVDFENNNLNLVDFNQVGYFAPDYHPSYKSKTTFLNEMCLYGKGKEAALALNHGADPFVKIEFAQGSKQSLPFAGMFRRSARNNFDTADAVMKDIARNLAQGKQSVLENIWKSLGKDLRTQPKVAAIINETNKIYSSRDFSQEQSGKDLARQEQERKVRLQKEREEQAKREQLEREAKIRHEKDMHKLTSNILTNLGDMTAVSTPDIAIKIASFLKENKANAEMVPVLPNAEELEKIKQAALDKQAEQIRQNQERQKAEEAKKAQEQSKSTPQQPAKSKKDKGKRTNNLADLAQLLGGNDGL